jgi:hypothetical protein
MRDTPNFDDANLALRLYELRREPEMRKARAMIGRVVAGQPFAKVRRLFDYDHPENAHLRQVTSYWEMVASFVNRGILHPEIYMDTCGEGIFTFWCFRPHLEAIRALGRPRFLAQTERLVSSYEPARRRLEEIDKSMAARAAAKPRKRRG